MAIELISSERIEALIDFPALIRALRNGFRQGAVMPARVRHEIDSSDGASLFVMPAWQAGVGRIVKLMSAVPSNAGRGLRTSSEVLNVFDPVTGELRAVIEKRMFSTTEDLLPVISFNAKSSKEDQEKHANFVNRMVEKGYTPKQVRLLVEWYLRVRKSS